MTIAEPLARRGQDTEEAGAVVARKSAASIRDRIKRLYHDLGPMTDNELEPAYLGAFGPQRRFFGNTLRRRRHELSQVGEVVKTGETRTSEFGVQNIVWTIAR